MFMYYTVCYFTGLFYVVIRQISMLFIDNKDSVFCKSDYWLRLQGAVTKESDDGLKLQLTSVQLVDTDLGRGRGATYCGREDRPMARLCCLMSSDVS